MLFERFEISDLLQLTVFFHCFIPRNLCLGLSPCLFGRVPSWQPAIAPDITSDLCCDNETEVTATKLFERYGVLPAIGFIGHIFLTVAYLMNGHAQVAIPFHGVHA